MRNLDGHDKCVERHWRELDHGTGQHIFRSERERETTVGRLMVTDSTKEVAMRPMNFRFYVQRSAAG